MARDRTRDLCKGDLVHISLYARFLGSQLSAREPGIGIVSLVLPCNGRPESLDRPRGCQAERCKQGGASFLHM